MSKGTIANLVQSIDSYGEYDLFTVKCLNQDAANKIPIASGITFGFINKPVVFEITSEEVSVPLRINLNVRKDKNRGVAEFDSGNVLEGVLDIDFYNPTEGGTSGLRFPIGLVSADKNLLALMFYIDTLPESNAFRLSYEFYHGILGIDAEGNPSD